MSAQDVPNWPGHIGRRQRRGRNLIEQRLEAMIVLAIDRDDIGGCASQRLSGVQAAEPGADDPPLSVSVPAWCFLRSTPAFMKL